jgi:outer membrane protein
MKRPVCGALAVASAGLVGIIAAGPASAEDRTLTLGFETTVSPKYEGSSRYSFGIMPKFDLRPAGKPAAFGMPSDGFDYALVELGWLRAGPVAKLRDGRSSDDIPGLSSIPVRIEAGAFVELWPTQWLRLRDETRAVISGDGGLDGSVSATIVAKPLDRWTLGFGPRMTYGDQSFNDTYFGISSHDSLVSGLATYSASSGIRTVGLEGMASYQLTPQMRTYGFGGYDRIVGTAADSPIVKRGTTDEFTVGIGMTYDFNVKF